MNLNYVGGHNNLKAYYEGVDRITQEGLNTYLWKVRKFQGDTVPSGFRIQELNEVLAVLRLAEGERLEIKPETAEGLQQDLGRVGGTV